MCWLCNKKQNRNLKMGFCHLNSHPGINQLDQILLSFFLKNAQLDQQVATYLRWKNDLDYDTKIFGQGGEDKTNK